MIRGALGSRYGISPLGRGVIRPAAGGWWLSGGIAAANCIAAYQAKGAPDEATSLIDLTGNGYDIDGGVAPSFNGSTGWQFNGTTNYLDVSNFPINNGDFTLAIFAKPNITTSTTSTFCCPNSINPSLSPTLGWIFKAEQWNNTGKIGYTVRNKADYTSSILTPTTDSVYFCTKTGTAVNIYVGESSSSLTTAVMNDIINTGMRIGGTISSLGSSTDPFNGYIYAVAYYNEVLSSGQISNIKTVMAAL